MTDPFLKDWPLLPIASKISLRLEPLSDGAMPHEIIYGEPATMLVMDIDGTDYALTIEKVTNQRKRPLPSS